MIAIDAGLLESYLLDEGNEDSDRAVFLIESSLADGERLFVAHMVLADLVESLERLKGVTRARIASLVSRVHHSKELIVEDGPVLERALAAYQKGPGSLRQYLLREHARAAGCHRVFTMCADLMGEPGFLVA